MHVKRLILALICLAAAMLLVSCDDDAVEAPTGGTSTLAGVVDSVSSDPVILAAVPGVTVTLIGTNADGEEFELETVTDAAGAFLFEQLTGGDYTLVITSTDGAGNEIQGSVMIRIRDGQRIDIIVSMTDGGVLTIAVPDSGTSPELVTVYNCSNGVLKQRKITREMYDADPSAYTRVPPTCMPTVVLDQSQLNSGGGGAHVISVIGRALQTFTPGVSGNLVKVDVQLTLSIWGVPGDMKVDIITVPGGDPNVGALLGTATIPAAAIGGGLQTVTFSPGIALTAGMLYAIRLSPVVGGECNWVWDNGANPYADGLMWSDVGVGTFTTLPGDAVFQTYMEVPAP